MTSETGFSQNHLPTHHYKLRWCRGSVLSGKKPPEFESILLFPVLPRQLHCTHTIGLLQQALTLIAKPNTMWYSLYVTEHLRFADVQLVHTGKSLRANPINLNRLSGAICRCNDWLPIFGCQIRLLPEYFRTCSSRTSYHKHLAQILTRSPP